MFPAGIVFSVGWMVVGGSHGWLAPEVSRVVLFDLYERWSEITFRVEMVWTECVGGAVVSSKEAVVMEVLCIR